MGVGVGVGVGVGPNERCGSSDGFRVDEYGLSDSMNE